MTILDQLADHARERVKAARRRHSLEEIRRAAFELPRGNFAFENALKGPDISFICECKKASPSKGLIAPDFPYLEIAKEYEDAGADGISVLTEPKWFLGSDAYLEEIAGKVSLPCLRKDFTVDESMLYEAKLLGASAVLLICAILSEEQIREYIQICDDLGLSALTEAHNEAEVHTALRAGARIIGVNNRNLKDFSVDRENSRRLREMIPKDILFVSESGVRSAEDVEQLRQIGADAVLIGETLMRAGDKKAKLAELRGRNQGKAATKIKLCGLSRPCDIAAANEWKPDYVGFVFSEKSRRYVSEEKAAELRRMLGPKIRTVGVFVDEEPGRIAGLLERGIIDAAQLHGQEDESDIRRLRGKLKGGPQQEPKLIKAFAPVTARDVEAANTSSADLILLDSPGGGTGTAFDWNLLRGIRRPYFLAGGLDPDNVGEAVKILKPYGVDVSSGVETDGCKDQIKIERFLEAVRNIPE